MSSNYAYNHLIREGHEATAYNRGTDKLLDGEASVLYSDHFIKVTNTTTVTIQLTAGPFDTYGLTVVEKRTNGFKVKELQNGKGNFAFDWEVKRARKFPGLSQKSKYFRIT